MTGFEWFLLIIVVIVVPLIVAVVVTLWSIDQANKRKRTNRKDPQVGVKRKAALSPEEVEARKAARAENLTAAEADAAVAADPGETASTTEESPEAVSSESGNAPSTTSR
jgi:FtsZ-interacting cell division protein ZipA